MCLQDSSLTSVRSGLLDCPAQRPQGAYSGCGHKRREQDIRFFLPSDAVGRYTARVSMGTVLPKVGLHNNQSTNWLCRSQSFTTLRHDIGHYGSNNRSKYRSTVVNLCC